MNHFEKFNNWLLDIHKNKGKKLIESQSPFEMEVVAKEGVVTGVNVSNLGAQSYLPVTVFHATLFLLQAEGGKALKGNAFNSKLGQNDLPVNSVDGFIATVVYNKKPGISVLARISPVSNILIEASVCSQTRDGFLHLS